MASFQWSSISSRARLMPRSPSTRWVRVRAVPLPSLPGASTMPTSVSTPDTRQVNPSPVPGAKRVSAWVASRAVGTPRVCRPQKR